MTLQTKFNIDDKVIVKDAGDSCIYTIISIEYTDKMGVEYAIFKDGHSKEMYLRKEEDLVLVSKQTLTPEEKSYLEAVIRPFRYKIQKVGIRDGMVAIFTDSNILHDTYLPITEEMQFKGLKRMYDIGELGLFEGEQVWKN